MIATAHEIKSVLPCLRRYAAALTGTTRSGDRYVATCLETILNDPALLNALRPTRLQLFELFHDVVSVFEPLLVEETSDVLPNSMLKRRIAELPLQEREVLLLSQIADFSHEEIAEILALSLDQVAADLVAARSKLMARHAVGVLVIEDEAMTAIDLAAIVHRSGHTLLGVAATRSEALRLAQKRRPDIILADVRLGRGESGVATVSEIAGDHPLPVIFITGHVSSLLEQSTDPQFVIAKPFERETVEKTMTEALGGWMLPSQPAADRFAS